MNNTALIIREGQPTDEDILVQFNTMMAMETEELFLPEQGLRKGVGAALNDPAKGRYYLALLDGEVVGSLMITREWSDWRNHWIAWIQSVYVKKEYRRRGVYSALYAHIRKMVDEGLFAGIRLYVDIRNVKAQQAYASLGMDGDHYRLFEWMK